MVLSVIPLTGRSLIICSLEEGSKSTVCRCKSGLMPDVRTNALLAPTPSSKIDI